MIKFTDIFAAVNEVLLASFDNIEVYKERIYKQKRPDMSVEVISFTTGNASRFIVNKSVDLDIIYFSKDNSVGKALVVADRLMSAFSMGLTVRVCDAEGKLIDKRTLHCLKSPEYKLVDQDLHFLVRFDFADEFEPCYLSDDEVMRPYNRALEPGQVDMYKPNGRKYPHDSFVKGTDDDKGSDVVRPADQRDYVVDVGFESEDVKKSYEDEKIKLMDSLKLNYIFMEV